MAYRRIYINTYRTTRARVRIHNYVHLFICENKYLRHFQCKKSWISKNSKRNTINMSEKLKGLKELHVHIKYHTTLIYVHIARNVSIILYLTLLQLHWSKQKSVILLNLWRPKPEAQNKQSNEEHIIIYYYTRTKLINKLHLYANIHQGYIDIHMYRGECTKDLCTSI